MPEGAGPKRKTGDYELIAQPLLCGFDRLSTACVENTVGKRLARSAKQTTARVPDPLLKNQAPRFL
jgi:hypothetical protein